MKKSINVMVLSLVIILLIPVTISASSDLDINFFARIFNVEDDKLDYFTKFDISNDDLSTIFYLYSNGDRTISKNQFEYLANNQYNWRELSIYFGLPPIMFEDEVVKLRRPQRNRMQVPFNKKSYKNSRKTKNVEEKIEVKQNKYEYYYKSNKMEERLSAHNQTNKYEYYYKNFETGKEIKKEGQGRLINSDKIYSELREEYEKEEDKKDSEQDVGSSIQFDFKIEFSF
jgi:hypothetical protein